MLSSIVLTGAKFPLDDPNPSVVYARLRGLPYCAQNFRQLYMVYRIEAVDSDEAAGAPEREIEVTPAMIEAGYRRLLASGITDDPLEADRLVVVEIYRAMRECSPALYSSFMEPCSPSQP